MMEQNVIPSRNDITSEIIGEIRSAMGGGPEAASMRTSVRSVYEVYSLFTLFTGEITRRARVSETVPDTVFFYLTTPITIRTA